MQPKYVVVPTITPVTDELTDAVLRNVTDTIVLEAPCFPNVLTKGEHAPI